MLKELPEEQENEIHKLGKEDSEIITGIYEAIEELWEKDSWLLIQQLSERCIAHKLAIYLESRFPDYDIDCEYNGDIDSDNLKKNVGMYRAELLAIGKELYKREEENGDEVLIRPVFPDIIIHSRKTHINNLCAIEIKTGYSSKLAVDYDDLKLKAYTRTIENRGLGYQLGIFLSFIRRRSHLSIEDTRYKNGQVEVLDGDVATAL